MNDMDKQAAQEAFTRLVETGELERAMKRAEEACQEFRDSLRLDYDELRRPCTI